MPSRIHVKLLFLPTEISNQMVPKAMEKYSKVLQVRNLFKEWRRHSSKYLVETCY